MYEDGWELFSGGLSSPATREDFLTAVSDLDAVMVRATVDDRGRDVENVLRYRQNNVVFFIFIKKHIDIVDSLISER